VVERAREECEYQTRDANAIGYISDSRFRIADSVCISCLILAFLSNSFNHSSWLFRKRINALFSDQTLRRPTVKYPTASLATVSESMPQDATWSNRHGVELGSEILSDPMLTVSCFICSYHWTGRATKRALIMHAFVALSPAFDVVGRLRYVRYMINVALSLRVPCSHKRHRQAIMCDGANDKQCVGRVACLRRPTSVTSHSHCRLVRYKATQRQFDTDATPLDTRSCK